MGRPRLGLLLIAFGVFTTVAGVAADWTQFRGPDGTGIAEARGVPLTWSESSNITWKAPIHGRGWSSPVVLGSQVWVTTATPDGRKLSALAIDRETGKIEYDLSLFDVETPQYAHPFNSYASPSPAIEPGRVYVTFGSPGTAAIDTKTGKVQWTRRDFVCNHFRGAGSSPVIAGNLLLMHFDGSDHQFVVALDKRTGKTVWRTERSVDFKDIGPDGKIQAEGDFRKAFATPRVVTVGGKPVMFSIGSKAAYGYELSTGKELWRIEEPTNHSGSTVPAVGDGLVYYQSGFPRGQLLAVRPDGAGDATATHVVWRVTRSVPNKPSVLLKDGLIYMIGDAGVASAVDAKTGEIVWSSRVNGSFSASPVAADGRVYFFSEEGKTTVIQEGREFKVLAENQLGDGFMATPAISGRSLFLRSRTNLYRID
jgi:outer membrane protein assembly factor BamB